MKNQEKRPCPLCERHQRMETTSGMLFWVEWGEDGNPRPVSYTHLTLPTIA